MFNFLIGITQASLIRITAKAEGTGVNMYYKDNSTAHGWFPRPVMAGECKEWRKAFKPDGNNQGFPIEVQTTASNEKGNRQSWNYDVTFAGGEKKKFNLPCPTLPLYLTRDMVLQRLQLVPIQKFHESFYQNKAKIFENIKKLLHHRLMGDRIDEWEVLFFEKFPLDEEDERLNGHVVSTLQRLVRAYHGPVRVASQESEPVGKSYYVDPIIYKGNFLFHSLFFNI